MKTSLPFKYFVVGYVCWLVWFIFYSNGAQIPTRETLVLSSVAALVVAIYVACFIAAIRFIASILMRLLFVTFLFVLWYLLWGSFGSLLPEIARAVGQLPSIGSAPVYLDDLVEWKSYLAVAMPTFVASFVFDVAKPGRVGTPCPPSR